jgi:hypothetical protein
MRVRAAQLFEEPGTLEQVARLAAVWFQEHVMRVRPSEEVFTNDVFEGLISNFLEVKER